MGFAANFALQIRTPIWCPASYWDLTGQEGLMPSTNTKRERAYVKVRKGASLVTKNNVPSFHVGNEICIGQRY